MAESECDGRVRVRVRWPSTLADSEYDGRVRLQYRVRMAVRMSWPNHTGRVNFGRVSWPSPSAKAESECKKAESECYGRVRMLWPSPNGCPNEPAE